MIDDFLVSVDTPVRDVLLKIDANMQGAAFVVGSDGVLCGVVTDGDIRRALVSGAAIDVPIRDVMTTKCVSLPYWSDPQTIFSHLAGRIWIIPLVDEQGRPVDYASLSRHHQIPVAEPLLGGNEFQYVTECLRTNWISSKGPFIERFEKDFSTAIGARHAVAVSNGTTGLHLALEALGIGPGDEVIVPDLTFAASASAVLHAGATPVLVDVSPDTWCIDPEAMTEAISDRTRAVMPVHLYGQPAEMATITEIARRHQLLIIEDAAEALGAVYHGGHAGTFGDAAVFSFYGNKLITTGEGGMIVFKSGDHAERAKRLRNQGMDPERRYWHLDIGYNYRMTNIQAAIGVAQLERLDSLIEKKLELARQYCDQLADVPGITLPVERQGIQNIYWAFSILVDGNDAGASRDRLVDQLARNGVETRPLFYPLHAMPPFRQFAGGRSFRNTEALSRRGFSLPSSATLKPEQVRHITSIICQTMSRWAMIEKIAPSHNVTSQAEPPASRTRATR